MRNAHELHAAMRTAVQQYRKAEQNIVLIFAELLQSHAYRELGYAFIHEYMEREFGFSDSKTRQFVMLARAMHTMPELAEAVEKRELEWTRAVDVARTATPRSAGAWVGKARNSSRAELRQEIRRARGAQVEAASLLEPTAPTLETMTDIRLRMDAVQLERYERALAQLRQRGQADVESILAGLELQLQSANGRVRRQTLERDQYRRARCRTSRGLQVHHIHERQFGGGHTSNNLKTLCRACHGLVHAIGPGG